MDLSTLSAPVVQAPMAGGPSTPRLAAAVSNAGGLGFLAAGYLSPERLRVEIEATTALTAAPFGVNLFVPSPAAASAEDVARYRQRLSRSAAAWGIEPGSAGHDDDACTGKIALLLEYPVPVVSFAFGLPGVEVIASLKDVGSTVLVTVTRAEEAVRATAAGADVLVVQGIEAGGHRGGFTDDGTDDLGILVLLRLVAARTDRPLIAAGGVTDGLSLAGVLAAGAVAAQLGTAFLRSPEAGTNPVHRQALTGDGSTVLTRAFGPTTGCLVRPTGGDT